MCGRWRRATRAAACGAALEVVKTVEIGHIFKLGYKYSSSMGLHVTSEAGRRGDADHGVGTASGSSGS